MCYVVAQAVRSLSLSLSSSPLWEVHMSSCAGTLGDTLNVTLSGDPELASNGSMCDFLLVYLVLSLSFSLYIDVYIYLYLYLDIYYMYHFAVMMR